MFIGNQIILLSNKIIFLKVKDFKYPVYLLDKSTIWKPILKKIIMIEMLNVINVMIFLKLIYYMLDILKVTYIKL